MKKIHESNVEKNVDIRKAAIIGCGFVGSEDRRGQKKTASRLRGGLDTRLSAGAQI